MIAVEENMVRGRKNTGDKSLDKLMIYYIGWPDKASL